MAAKQKELDKVEKEIIHLKEEIEDKHKEADGISHKVKDEEDKIREHNYAYRK